MGDKNRRQDFRIDDILAMSDKPLSKEEYIKQQQFPGIRSRQNAMIQSIIGKEINTEQLKAVVNHDLALALETLDTKLNYLIGVNMLNDANRSNLKERSINLSVTGASFRTEDPYNKGDYIGLALMIPSFPPTIIELIGHVTRVEQESLKTQHIGVHFTYRCNEEESSIAKYVFQRHRETIRLNTKAESTLETTLN